MCCARLTVVISSEEGSMHNSKGTSVMGQTWEAVISLSSSLARSKFMMVADEYGLLG
jgi:hypothetical protein